VLDGARGLPGVRDAALTSERPYLGEGLVKTMTPEGMEDAEDGVWVSTRIVSPGYFELLGIPVLEGRGLAPGDDQGEPAAVVSETFARTYWPTGDALGRRVLMGSTEDPDGPVYRIVGVVGDVRQRPGSPAPASLYVPLRANPWPTLSLVVRTDPGATAAAATALRDLVRRTDPTLPPGTVTPLNALAREGRARPRFYTALLGSFGLLALALALVGIYATTAYATRSRTREIGIRMALGAHAGRVVGEVVRRTGGAVLGGALVGLAAAWASATVLSDALRYVDPRDATTHVGVAALVVAAGVAAAWLPAARAARVDPATTLREDG
jgi:hypothetical protein